MGWSEWTDEQRRNLWIAAGFVVIIAILLVVLLCKWPPSQWAGPRVRRVQFAPDVEEIPAPESPDVDPGATPAAPPASGPLPGGGAAPEDAVEEDGVLRDSQNKHALLLRSGGQVRNGAPTTGAMLFGSYNTRLEAPTRGGGGGPV